jgi:hypothetical protein
MLRSFFKHHGPTHVLVSENSTNNDTEKLLVNNDVPHIRAAGALHGPTVNTLLLECSTDYALLVDTDIIFHKSCEEVFEQFKSLDLTLLGDICGDRGGKRLHHRVHPWFCFINVKRVNEHNIKFYDIERHTNKGDIIYDIGSTFFEDIRKAKLKIGDIKLEDNVYTHFEGMSWRTQKFGLSDGDIDIDKFATHNNIALYNYGKQVEEAYSKEILKFKDIEIKAL